MKYIVVASFTVAMGGQAKKASVGDVLEEAELGPFVNGLLADGVIEEQNATGEKEKEDTLPPPFREFPR